MNTSSQLIADMAAFLDDHIEQNPRCACAATSLRERIKKYYVKHAGWPIDRQLFSRLHDLQFKKEYDSRAGGVRVVSFQKQVGDRLIEVQLWGDGMHRVTHMLRGRSTTEPTSFQSLAEMNAAIEKEKTRTDQAA